MLKDSAPIAVLTHGPARASLERGMAALDDRLPVLVVEEDAAWMQEAAANPDPAEVGLTSRHLSHVIYTSGSTGAPKGAMNSHRGICNRLLWMQSAYALSSADRVLQKTPVTFDVSVWEFFWPLTAGACLVMARPGGHRDPAYLVREIIQQGITTLHFVPSLLPALFDEPGFGAAHPCGASSAAAKPCRGICRSASSAGCRMPNYTTSTDPPKPPSM